MLALFCTFCTRNCCLLSTRARKQQSCCSTVSSSHATLIFRRLTLTVERNWTFLMSFPYSIVATLRAIELCLVMLFHNHFVYYVPSRFDPNSWYAYHCPHILFLSNCTPVGDFPCHPVQAPSRASTAIANPCYGFVSTHNYFRSYRLLLRALTIHMLTSTACSSPKCGT